jgi:4-amino-4-deoxy-L-arabinose transferase-like glycosyltransferase
MQPEGRTPSMIEPNHAEWETWLQKWFIPLLIPAILVNAGGLFIPILEPDGSLYATIAKTMARTGDFIGLHVDGKDWLDKPHFPFWMAALSFRVLGVNAFAYKFPALLFWAAGAFYTWRLALSLYGKPVAQLATLIYVSAAHLVISNNDVRAEPYLTGLIIGAVYHFYKASRANQTAGSSGEGSWLPHIIAGSFLSACACMTKGPFVLITIGAGFILDWIWGKEWEQFRHIRWWLAIVLTAVFMLPELICLYLQFDRHPEKLVFGHTGVSGIRFFFWDSQFGRFFNTGPIKGSGDPFFYFHTLLWAFLPWSLLLYAAILRRPRRSVPGDLICLGGAVASFVIFSLSRFQLPHYLNILFPFFSILTAGYLYTDHRRVTRKTIRIVQNTISVLLPILLLLLCWFFHFNGWPLLLVLIVVLAILPFVLFRTPALSSPIARSFWMSMLVFAFINFILYPSMLRYQAGTQAGRYLETHPELMAASTPTTSAAGTPPSATANPAAAASPAATPTTEPPVAYLLLEAPASFSFEFDAPGSVARVPVDSLPHPLPAGGIIVFAPTNFADTLSAKGYQAAPLQHFDYFHISQLTGEFLNYRTRAGVLKPWELYRVTR